MSRAPGVLSRDVAALAAFGAVAVSGVLPLPILVIFPVVFVVSLLGHRPLAGRRVASVIVLLLLAVLLFGSVWLSLLDLVVAAVSFATLVTCHRMLAEPTPQASRQVLLSGLLLVAGGAALTGEALFAILMVAFFFAASWSMAWLVLARDDAHLEAPERRAISRQLLTGGVATLIMGLVFFVLFPRLSWNLANRRSAGGLGGVTGMSETVKLGGGGDIKTSARVAFRVTLTPDPNREHLDAYFVGRHFDAFDGLEWRSTGKPGAAASWASVRKHARRAPMISQEYELTAAFGSRTLVALETVATITRARAITLSGAQVMPVVLVPDDQVFGTLEGNVVTYLATSDQTPQVDRAPPSAAASQIPQHDPRIEQLANEITADTVDPLAIANKLEAQLKQRYAYTLDLPGDVADPLADFLFVRRAGHCEDFATALAVMLRLKGIPSRVVTGFFGGEQAGNRYVVRSGDAHAWVEASIDGGWRRFDATPDLGRSASGSRLAAALASAWEKIEEWWRSRVVDYSFQDQLSFARSLVRPSQPQDMDVGPRAPPADRTDQIRVVVGSLGVALLVLALWLRRRGVIGVHPATTFLREIETRLKGAGVAQVDELPIEELAASLTRQAHPLAPALAQATRRYLEARFSGAKLDVGEQATLLSALQSPPR